MMAIEYQLEQLNQTNCHFLCVLMCGCISIVVVVVVYTGNPTFKINQRKI